MNYRDIRIDNSEIRSLLTQLDKKLSDLTPVFASIGEMLQLSHIERWGKDQQPDGSEWMDLKPASWEKKKNPRKLRERNHMLGVRNITYSADVDQLVFSMTDEKAPWHHFGTQNKAGETIIPARVLLGLSADDKLEVAENMKDYLF